MKGMNKTEIGSGYCATLRPFCLVSFLDIRLLLLIPTQSYLVFYSLFVYPFIEIPCTFMKPFLILVYY